MTILLRQTLLHQHLKAPPGTLPLTLEDAAQAAAVPTFTLIPDAFTYMPSAVRYRASEIFASSSGMHSYCAILKRFKSPDTDAHKLERFVTQHIIDALSGFLVNIK